ncbi:MAG: OmpA family protein [Myxococcales bacterium]|nr:OmpA family protein [Myxococcales bacterium]
MRSLRSTAAFAIAVLCSGVAGAEPEVALDRFEPAPAGDALLSTPDFDVGGANRLSLGASFLYAHEPLVLFVERNDGTSERTVLVDHQALLHLQGSFALSRSLLVEADLPTIVSQGGDRGRAGALSLGDPSGSDVGDLRVGSRLALLDQKDFVPGASFAASLWFPTATGRYAGTSSVRAGAGVVFGTNYDHFFWRANLGARQRDAASVYSGVFGSEAFSSLGIGYRYAALQLGTELLGATSMDAKAGWFGGNTTHLEALASVRYTIAPVSAFLGAGPGLTRGAGTPAFRVVAGLTASFELLPAASAKPSAAAGATAANSNGAANGAAATSPHPAIQDRDHDGVIDASDACPDVPGEPDAERPGCPSDKDGDAIPDAIDACPTEPGPKSADPARHGCPADRDGDGIPDTVDACPDEKGAKTEDPKTTGCPTSVRVVGQQIVITEQVNFATGSDVLAAESSKVLEQVAGVLTEHPEIARIAVDGHTDNVGADKANLALSRRRAIAVLRWLVAHGVDERRIEARGFGARRPIADVKSTEGRAKNRRVEFQILKKTEKGAQGWKDGPVDE